MNVGLMMAMIVFKVMADAAPVYDQNLAVTSV